MGSIFLYSGYENSDARNKINIYKNEYPTTKDKLYDEALSQATNSVDMENMRWNSEKISKLKLMVGNFELSKDRHRQRIRPFFNPKILYKQVFIH